jgi:ribosomal protein S8
LGICRGLEGQVGNKMNKLFVYFCISLRNSNLAKRMFVDVQINKFLLSVLNILYLNGFISGYRLVGRNKARVFLKYYDGRGLLDAISVFGSLVLRQYVSGKKIRYLFRRSNLLNDSFVLISTSDGLVTSTDYLARNSKVGGLLLFKIKQI